MATKNAIIKGVSAGDTSVTFETTKDWAVPAELTIPISVLKDEDFYLLNEEANGKKSYLAFIADLKNYNTIASYKEPSLKCLRLYLNDGTLLRCVKATRIEDINANTKHKYFVNLDKGNVTQDLFSYFELIFSTTDPLKTGQQNVAALYNASVTFDENIHYKIGFICPTSYYSGYEIAPFMKNDIWYYARDYRRSLLEQYFIFKDSSLTADDISKIGMANHSYTDAATAYGNIYFNYLLFKKLNYRNVELSSIEIDESNFDGKKTYYIDLFLKDSTFKMWDYMTEFFNYEPRYDEDIKQVDDFLLDYRETGDAILDEYNKLDRPYNPNMVCVNNDNPTEQVLDDCPTSINTSGMDFYTLHFKGQGYVNNVELTWMVSMINLRFYLSNGDLLYPINIRTLNTDLSADMPTKEALGNVYEEYEIILSKTELTDGYPTRKSNLIDNGKTLADSPDYVKLRLVVNKLYYGLHLNQQGVSGAYSTDYLSLKNYHTNTNIQSMQMHILFDNDSRITPDELGKVSANNSIEIGKGNIFSGWGYTYGFNEVYVARSSSDNARKLYKQHTIKANWIQRVWTFYINLNDNEIMLRDATKRWQNTTLPDGTIVPERYL